MSDKERLDKRIRALYSDLSWTRIRNAIERGQVTVDGHIARDPGATVAASASVDFNLSRRALPSARLDLDRLYEDEQILVVDKPAGLLTIATDPELRAVEDTVLRRVQEYAKYLHGPRGYAGVLHRLDRGTSGALAVALTRQAHAAGRELFAEHEFDRWYLAIVQGVPEHENGTIEAHISNEYAGGRRRIVRDEAQGRHAVTHYTVREAFADTALLELRLETGRQHQIRLHLERLGHPLVGEHVYQGSLPSTTAADNRSARRGADGVRPKRGVSGTSGHSPRSRGAFRAPRPLLHAWRLEFPHPMQRKTVRAEAPIPRDFQRALTLLRRMPQR